MFFLLDFKQTSRNFTEETVEMCPLVQNTEGCKQRVKDILSHECQVWLISLYLMSQFVYKGASGFYILSVSLYLLLL